MSTSTTTPKGKLVSLDVPSASSTTKPQTPTFRYPTTSRPHTPLRNTSPNTTAITTLKTNTAAKSQQSAAYTLQFTVNPISPPSATTKPGGVGTSAKTRRWSAGDEQNSKHNTKTHIPASSYVNFNGTKPYNDSSPASPPARNLFSIPAIPTIHPHPIGAHTSGFWTLKQHAQHQISHIHAKAAPMSTFLRTRHKRAHTADCTIQKQRDQQPEPIVRPKPKLPFLDIDIELANLTDSAATYETLMVSLDNLHEVIESDDKSLLSALYNKGIVPILLSLIKSCQFLQVQIKSCEVLKALLVSNGDDLIRKALYSHKAILTILDVVGGMGKALHDIMSTNAADQSETQASLLPPNPVVDIEPSITTSEITNAPVADPNTGLPPQPISNVETTSEGVITPVSALADGKDLGGDIIQDSPSVEDIITDAGEIELENDMAGESEEVIAENGGKDDEEGIGELESVLEVESEGGGEFCEVEQEGGEIDVARVQQEHDESDGNVRQDEGDEDVGSQ